MIASPAVASRPWAGEAAFDLARSWARGGARIMLADLGLTDPTLHRAVDVENGEGMTDVFLYGASIQRIAHPISDGTLFFAPAGTLIADAREVFSHSRWDSLEQGFGSAGALLLLYAPASQDGLDSILSRASGVVVLGSGEDSVSDILNGASIPVLAALAPAEPLTDGSDDLDFRLDEGGEELPPLVPEEGDEEEATAAAVGAGPDDEGDAGEPLAGEVHAVGAPDEEGETRAAAAPGSGDDPAVEEAAAEAAPEPAPEEAVAEAPEVAPAAAGSGSRQTLRIFLVMLLVIAAAAAAVWYGFIELPEGFEIPFLTNSPGSSAG